LDSAGYAAFTVTQPISIVASPGVTAGISTFSGNGITINAGTSDVVVLRGLSVNNQGSTGNGIIFENGGMLHVENCTVSGFSQGSGLLPLSPGELDVKDSTFRSKVGGASAAIVDHVRLEGTDQTPGVGLFVGDAVVANVRNSSAAHFGGAG